MNPLDYAMSALIVFALLCIAGKMDQDDAQVIAAHKSETVAAARQEAHEKAVRLRHDGLLDDANRMLWPIGQAHEPQSTKE